MAPRLAPMVDSGLRPVPLARRVAAYAIDVTLLYLVVMAIQLGVLQPLREVIGQGWQRSGWALELYTLCTISAPAWFYFAAFEGRGGATPGKQLCRIRVAGLGGERLGLRRGLLRAVVKLVPWETAHLSINLPHNSFIDPVTGEFAGWEYGELRPTIAVPYVLLAIWVVVMWRSPRRQSVHDFAARSVVVTAKPGSVPTDSR